MLVLLPVMMASGRCFVDEAQLARARLAATALDNGRPPLRTLALVVVRPVRLPQH